MTDKVQKQKVTGDLLELSDLFRRAAVFDRTNDVAQIVSLTRKLGTGLTSLSDYMDDRELLVNLRHIIDEISAIASDLGLEEIKLPLGTDTPEAEILKNSVLRSVHRPVRFSFRTNEYNKDLSKVGEIQFEIQTILDEDLHEFFPISDALKSQWKEEHDTKTAKQFQLPGFDI